MTNTRFRRITISLFFQSLSTNQLIINSLINRQENFHNIQYSLLNLHENTCLLRSQLDFISLKLKSNFILTKILFPSILICNCYISFFTQCEIVFFLLPKPPSSLSKLKVNVSLIKQA